MKNSEQPAYPVTRRIGNNITETAYGISKREYFAVMALQGILSSRGLQQALSRDSIYWEDYAIEIADKLLEKLETK